MLFELLYMCIVAALAIAGAHRGFFGLVVGLTIGYVALCLLDCALLLPNAFRERMWVFRYPAADIRYLNYYVLHFCFPPGAIWIWFVGYILKADHPLQISAHAPRSIIGGLCALILSTAVCLVGLLILWGWTVKKLGATDEVSSSLSKPVEMVVCYALLIAGLLWVAVATYMPIWVTWWIVR